MGKSRKSKDKSETKTRRNLRLDSSDEAASNDESGSEEDDNHLRVKSRDGVKQPSNSISKSISNSSKKNQKKCYVVRKIYLQSWNQNIKVEIVNQKTRKKNLPSTGQVLKSLKSWQQGLIQFLKILILSCPSLSLK